MSNFGILIDDGVCATEIVAKSSSEKEMVKLIENLHTATAVQSFIDKHQQKKVPDTMKLIPATDKEIYFYALLNAEEQRYDWYVIDVSFNKMMQGRIFSLDRMNDWFDETGERL